MNDIKFKIIFNPNNIKIINENILYKYEYNNYVFYKINPFVDYEKNIIKKYLKSKAYQDISKILPFQWLLEINKIENKYKLFTDRLGIYPLYYTLKNNDYIFSNNIKLLLKGFKNIELNKLKLYENFLIRYTYGGETLIKDLKRTEGSQIYINKNNNIKVIKKDIVNENNYIIITDEELEELILDKLSAIIKHYKNILDINTNNTTNLLSGGVDSSVLQYVLNNVIGKHFQTFSTSNIYNEYDESNYAIEASKYLDTIHTLVPISSDNFKNSLKKSIILNQEPIALYQGVAYSFVANYIPSYINIIFSGFGADLAFGEGLRKIKYSKYIRILPNLEKLFWYFRNNKLAYFSKFAYQFNKLNNDRDRLIFLQIVNDKNKVQKLLGYSVPLYDIFEERIKLFEKYEYLNYYDRIILVEFLTHNNKVTSHWNGVLKNKLMLFPFLDEHFINFILRIPVEQKVFKGKLKNHLKNICSTFSSKKFAYRKKKTGSLPIKNWIYNDEELRYWTFEYPNPYLDTKVLLEDSKDRYFDQLLWATLNFNLWYDYFVKC